MTSHRPQNDDARKILSGFGRATRSMVRARTIELASIAGRTPAQVSQLDYEQAKRDVTGQSDRDRQEAILDASPETERLHSLPRLTGCQPPEHPVWSSGNDSDECLQTPAALLSCQ